MIIKRRLYNDFLRPSLDEDYEHILKAAKDHGYEIHTVLSFEEIVKNGKNIEDKYLIIRKDVDTADFKILRKMLNLEVKYGARATYYFRWNTMNVALMREIEKAGGEASYHYEEIASYCFKHHIKEQKEVLDHLEFIRDLFILNYQRFKKKTNQPCLTVAAHGDFLNNIVGVPSSVLVDDRVRKACGIIREAYDRQRMELLSCRFADQVEMEHFTEKVIVAIKRGEPVLELLIHPRQWNSPIWINLKEEVVRIARGLYMKL